MAGVNEDNVLWIVIYHAVPNYVTFRLDPSALSQAQLAIFSDVSTRINPHLVIMEGKANKWEREAFHSSQCCCPVCLHIGCGSSLGLQLDNDLFVSKFCWSWRAALLPQEDEISNWAFSFVLSMFLTIQESLSMLSSCFLLLLLGFACNENPFPSWRNDLLYIWHGSHKQYFFHCSCLVFFTE